MFRPTSSDFLTVIRELDQYLRTETSAGDIPGHVDWVDKVFITYEKNSLIVEVSYTTGHLDPIRLRLLPVEGGFMLSEIPSGMDWTYIYGNDKLTHFQDSDVMKSRWLEEVERVWPIGMEVKVVKGEFEGQEVTVAAYDQGQPGEWPIICVAFADNKVDGVYEDQLGFR